VHAKTKPNHRIWSIKYNLRSRWICFAQDIFISSITIKNTDTILVFVHFGQNCYAVLYPRIENFLINNIYYLLVRNSIGQRNLIIIVVYIEIRHFLHSVSFRRKDLNLSVNLFLSYFVKLL